MSPSNGDPTRVTTILSSYVEGAAVIIVVVVVALQFWRRHPVAGEHQ
jgi:hypothetical protein